MDKRTVGENNKLEALWLVYKFGWLRSQEIGLFCGFWALELIIALTKNAEALIRKLVDQKLDIFANFHKIQGQRFSLANKE